MGASGLGVSARHLLSSLRSSARPPRRPAEPLTPSCTSADPVGVSRVSPRSPKSFAQASRRGLLSRQRGLAVPHAPSWSLRGPHPALHCLRSGPASLYSTEHPGSPYISGCSVLRLRTVSPSSCLFIPPPLMHPQPWFPGVGVGVQPWDPASPPPGISPQAGGGCAPIKPVESAEGFSSFNGFSLSMYIVVTHRSSPRAPGLPAGSAGVRSCPPPVPGRGWRGSSFRHHLLGTCRVPGRCRICACDRSAWQGCRGLLFWGAGSCALR